jgi:hypothetical protein
MGGDRLFTWSNNVVLEKDHFAQVVLFNETRTVALENARASFVVV